MFATIMIRAISSAIQSIINSSKHRIGHRTALLFEIILGNFPDNNTTKAIVFNPFTFPN